MKVFQKIYRDGEFSDFESFKDSDLVLMFGDISSFYETNEIDKIYEKNKNLNIIGCSTAGEIHDSEVTDNCLSVTSIDFEKSNLNVVSSEILNGDIKLTAQKLCKTLPKENLKSIMAFSVGHGINGTDLLDGLKEVVSDSVLITGGLAGDGVKFEKTFVSHNEYISDNLLVLVGLYGDNLVINSGCEGGWNNFGPQRFVTKSKGNVLYELDGIPALDLYKKYLGDKAKDLPSSALLFPLSLRINNEYVTRTILNINEEEGSMVFAGDIPENVEVQFMISNHNELIDGAENAAEKANSGFDNVRDGLLILVSCVGRKLVLKNYTENEVEVVSDVFGDGWKTCGFYSYGELAPNNNNECLLHNQTMTITAIGEIK